MKLRVLRTRHAWGDVLGVSPAPSRQPDPQPARGLKGFVQAWNSVPGLAKTPVKRESAEGLDPVHMQPRLKRNPCVDWASSGDTKDFIS
jgi:hypothetical protein